MSICVSVKVGEGLVLAADSTSVVFAQVAPNQPPAVVKTYDHARKLSHVKDYPIGTLAWGAGYIGDRSVESLIKQYEHGLPSLEEEFEKLKERRLKDNAENAERPKYSVREIAENLLKHIKSYYDVAVEKIPQQSRPSIGILVSGYSSGNFFPEQWLLEIPMTEKIEALRPDQDGKPVFGANWFGQTDAIVRLHWGRDEQVNLKIAEKFKVDPKEIHDLLRPLEYQVAFNGMPLQDAIDYANYLVNVAIGRFRFAVGAPLCGGEIDVAIITPAKFTWVQRKSWKVK